MRNTDSRKKTKDDASLLINSNIAAVGQIMSDLVDVEVENQISKLQHTQFELEMKLCDICEAKDARQIMTIDRRIKKIEL